MSGRSNNVPVFYLNQVVAVFAATLFLDGGRVLGILLALLLLLNATVYFFKISLKLACGLNYLLLVVAFCAASLMAAG